MGFGKFIRRAVNFFQNVNPVVSLIATLAVAWLFRPKVPDLPDFSINEADDFEKGVLLNKQSSDANIPVIYGERLVGGNRVFLETSGTDNQYLYLAIVMAEGEINSIEEIRVDDKVVTWASALSDGTEVEVGSGDSNFYKDGESLIKVEPHFGTDDQTASSILSNSSNWGSNHRLRGLCYLAFRFKWNQDVFGSIPKIQAKIKGKKVVAYNSSLVAQTAAYSTNPAWCLLDYLTNTRYGKGLSTSNINLQAFYDASVVCETQVEPYSGASNINIFDTNAVLDTSKKLLENVRELLKGCRGYLPYTEGKYKLVIETTGTASITLTEDDIVGGYNLSTPAKNEKYNRVIVSYVEPSRNFQVQEVQFPPIDDSSLPSADQHATMKTSDGGFLLEGRFDFSKVITNKYQAEEMAEIILRRTRDAERLVINVSFSAYDLAIGDIVNITHSSLGYTAKPFRVLSIKFNPDFTLGLDLVAHQDSHYTWATKEQAATVPSTNLPDPFSIQPPSSLTLSDQLIEYNDGTVIVALDITIGASTDSFVDFYQVEYKKSDETDFKILSQGSGLNHRVLNVIDQQEYNVRVKAVNTFQVSSSYVSASRTIVGGTASPSDVTEFSCNVVGQEAHLSWKSIPDLDLAYYSIRYSPLTSNAEWSSSVNLVQKVSRPGTSVVVPARIGSYLIKAVDKLGNLSINETIATTTVSGVLNFNAVETIEEHPTFLGTIGFDSAPGLFDDLTGNFDDGFPTNLAVSDGTLRLQSTLKFDSATGNFDDSSRLFDSGPQANTLPSEDFYTFANIIDIGSTQTVRLTATIVQTADNIDEAFDDETGDFDDKTGAFDGDTPENVRSVLQIATSTDNITYSDFSDFVIGEYNSRFFKFRMHLESLDNSSTPVIEQASVTADMVDRIQSENDITSGATTKTVSFTNPFFSVNYALGITAENMQSSDFYEISNRTVNGFDITFKNSGGSAVSRQFDFIAKGF